MIPAGYLLKRVAPPPGWLKVESLEEVCSVSDCVNENVVDVQASWHHNGFGLANDPDTLWRAVPDDAATDDARLFYYEAYERELESDGWTSDPQRWAPLTRAASAGVDDAASPPAPGTATLLGYDVVVFGDFLEHSPLSCNSVAENLGVNRYCLFEDLQAAISAIDTGGFGGGCEPGTYKVFSVSLVQSPER